MSPESMTIEDQALKLPPQERARLAERLIASLDEIDEAECERLWIEEAEHRYQLYKTGRLSSRPAEAVLHDARAALK
jgi:putative addiction module component (TIGR02574 family)